MAAQTAWRRQYVFNASNAANAFNAVQAGLFVLDTLPAGYTHKRCLFAASVTFAWTTALPSAVDVSGWWQDCHIHLGLYIPALPGHATFTPNPRLDSLDDNWIFDEELLMSKVNWNTDEDVLLIEWRLPSLRLDVTSLQGPAPSEGMSLELAWDWSDNDSAYFTNGSPHGASWVGIHAWSQNLYTVS